MVRDKRKKSFKGAVTQNISKQKRGSKQYGYLNLPKGIQMFKEEPGSKALLDILPYEVSSKYHPDRDEEYGIAVEGSLWYKRPFWIHRNVGPENNTVVCPSSIGKRCPICEYRAQRLKEGAAWDDEEIRALKTTMRNLYVVVPIDNPKYEEVPHIWDISQYLFQDKLNEEIQENEEYETFPDLEEGYTLSIRFSEETFGKNKYADVSRIDFKERSKPYPESILEKVPCLDDLLEIRSYKSLEALFLGADDAEIEEVNEIKKEEVEDEEVPFYDDDDDEEETKKEVATTIEEKPKRTKPHPVRATSDKCPFGHTFGKDVDKYDDCDDCDKWEDCIKESGAE